MLVSYMSIFMSCINHAWLILSVGTLSGVRSAAAESLPYLLDCARIRGPEYLQSMWLFMLPPLLQSIESEPENDVKADHMQSLASVRPSYCSKQWHIMLS